MKNGKKILGIILAVCMLLQMLPVFATDSTEIQTQTPWNIRTIVDYDFDDDIGDWVVGEFVGDKSEATLDRVDIDGVSALSFNATKVEASHLHNQQPTAYLDFEDVEFKEGNKVVIEMKFKQTGDETGTADSYLKYNRPNSQDIKTSYVDANGVTQTFNPAAFGENAANWWQMLRMYNNKINSDSGTMVEADTVNNWTDVKIVIDEGTKTYSVATKTGDIEGFAENEKFTGGIWEMQCFDGSKKDYDSLDSLTLFVRGYTNTIYVDYFRVYEIVSVKTKAQIIGGSTVEAGKTADIKLVSEEASGMKITAIPENAVTITDSNGEVLNVVQSFDAENQVISVMPVGDFAEGETYTIALNETALAENSIICNGTKTFTVTSRGARSTGFVVNDTFDDETSQWVIGNANDGYKAVTSFIDIEEGNKALAVTMENPLNASNGVNAVSSIVRKVGNGIEFEEGKNIIVKARMLVKSELNEGATGSASTKFHLRMNAPDYSVNVDQHAIGWPSYTLMMLGSSGVGHATGNGYAHPGGYGWFFDQSTISGTNANILNNWIDYTITVDGVNNKTTINAVCEEIGLDVTSTNSTYGITPTSLEREYGAGTTKTAFDALDTLSFALFDKGKYKNQRGRIL